MINFIVCMWFIVIVFLYVANLCYIKQLERQIEILEAKVQMFPALYSDK